MFKPLLAPNEKTDLSTLKYPLMASAKLDGIRCLFINGQILSRSLKPIQNKQLCERFEPIRQYSEEHNVVFDGEIYSEELTFQEITHYVMTQDLGVEPLPESLKFHCFDLIKQMDLNESFQTRYRNLELVHVKDTFETAVRVDNILVYSKEEVLALFEKARGKGQEGLILRDPQGRYKCGRGTIKEGLIYKVKPWETFDAKIEAVIQATEVNEDAEKKVNELGRSVTSKKKDDRHVIEKASAFLVYYNELPLKVTLAMTDEQKAQVWTNQNAYIGRMIEYKGMLEGAKDLPRHPVFVRFREDKNE